MTPDEFKKRMSLVHEQHEDDSEVLHIKADELLCRALMEAGYGEGVMLFQSFHIWYA